MLIESLFVCAFAQCFGSVLSQTRFLKCPICFLGFPRLGMKFNMMHGLIPLKEPLGSRLTRGLGPKHLSWIAQTLWRLGCSCLKGRVPNNQTTSKTRPCQFVVYLVMYWFLQILQVFVLVSVFGCVKEPYIEKVWPTVVCCHRNVIALVLADWSPCRFLLFL